MKSRVIRVFFILLLTLPMLVSMSGCAFGDRHVALQYNLSNGEGNGHKLASPMKIAVKKFEDHRDTKEIGEVRNGYGMKTAKVFPKTEDMGGWVANALCMELEQRGFQVEKFSEQTPPGYNLVLTGSINECYTAVKVGFMSYDVKTTLRSTALLKKDGVTVLNQEYKDEVKPLIAWAKADEYGDATEAALHAVMGQLVPDVIIGAME